MDERRGKARRRVRASEYGDDAPPPGAALQHLVREPMIRARLAAPTPAYRAGCCEPPLAGIAIRAKAPEEVDKNIREQIKSGAFPVRLKAEEWDSGEIAWLRRDCRDQRAGGGGGEEFRAGGERRQAVRASGGEQFGSD